MERLSVGRYLGNDDGDRSENKISGRDGSFDGENGRKDVADSEFEEVRLAEGANLENHLDNEFSGGVLCELPEDIVGEGQAVKDRSENGFSGKSYGPCKGNGGKGLAGGKSRVEKGGGGKDSEKCSEKEIGNGEKAAENGTVLAAGKLDGYGRENGVLYSDGGSSEKYAGNPQINGENLDNQKDEKLLRPHSRLPQPEAPPGLLEAKNSPSDQYSPRMERSVSEKFPVDMPSIGKFIRERGNSIMKRISSFKESDQNGKPSSVKEFNLPGLKVIVQLKPEELDFKGRISFFSRSNCRDCSAVRSFFREKRLKFVEINIDVYPLREKDLIQRTGSSAVPQIFFNEKLFGGLVALNSLRNSGQFEQRLKELTAKTCPANAPAVPVYGFDDPEEENPDQMLAIVRVLRQRLPIQDRLMKMKIVKNCFSGSEAVEILIQHMDCGRKKAIETGKQLARKHFIHHVFQENDFEDGNHFYRFLEHEPVIPKCFNFRGATNDDEPKPAALVGHKLTKIMSAILETYASNDRRHVHYTRISTSEEFRRYLNLVQDLQRVDVFSLSDEEKRAFFTNLYNAMVIHAVIRIGHAEGMIERRTFSTEFQYIVGGYPYSLSAIKNGILRSNRRQPYALVKPFASGDKRLEVALPKLNPLTHFGLCNGTKSSPTVRFFAADGIEAELRFATREFFLGDGVNVDLDKRTVYLTRIMKWFSVDFGQDTEILNWILKYMDATKAGLLTHLLSDGGSVNIEYQSYDWSLNS